MIGKDKVVSTNRKARFNYSILESFEAGIELKGTEVKSLRTGQTNLQDGYARVEKSEIFLYNVHISPYEFGNIANVDSVRPRKLFLHRNQINRLEHELATKHLTLIPLKVYFKNGLAKVELGVAKGKKAHDKRDAIKSRESDMELRRALKNN
jgi:SsrA-binding protein